MSKRKELKKWGSERKVQSEGVKVKYEDRKNKKYKESASERKKVWRVRERESRENTQEEG